MTKPSSGLDRSALPGKTGADQYPPLRRGTYD